MARQFNVPEYYRSSVITTVKETRRTQDPRKKDLSPSVIDFGPVRFKLARHFGFCFGVENAIEIAYRALSENRGKRIFLLSEMIHNSHVNRDLEAAGVRFLRTTEGQQLIPFDELTPDDVVIIPAFGTTLEVVEELEVRGVNQHAYDTTCPFVEKVWKRGSELGKRDYTVVLHGKRYHEETRATFSHAREFAPVVVVRDIDETHKLASVIRDELDAGDFFETFSDRCTEGFDPARDLLRIGVINQTTMLATETAEIAASLRQAFVDRYGAASIGDHFVDTSDTLCYATNENQSATVALIEEDADLAIVVGGYKSSNTSHLVELCQERMPTYFVSGADQILSRDSIRHFDIEAQAPRVTADWLPAKRPLTIILTAGASCPDALLEDVLARITGWFDSLKTREEALGAFMATSE